MEMTQRDRRALIAGGGALALIAVYFGIIEPVGARYNDLYQAHETAAAELARVVPKLQKSAWQAGQVVEFEKNSGPLGAPKPRDQAITSAGAEIIAAAQSSGIELQGTTPGAPTPWPDDPGYQMLLVQIDGKADWENVFKFIAALYRIEGVLSVEQMDLSASDPRKPGKLNLRLSVSLLLQADTSGGPGWQK